ncbi:peptidase M23 [Kitasatospora sp. NPDC058048]|uniref:CIS tube protein n=1 Tax=Kitasatospora sp. NPDC058048 TaxID=3346313 RepID=UPI0036DBF608
MSLSSQLGALVHAVLILFDPPLTGGAAPGPERGRLSLQFNPEQLEVRRSASWGRSDAPALMTPPPPQFLGSDPTSLGVRLFFDATAEHGRGVERSVTRLLECCRPEPHRASDRSPSPPWVRLAWGSARTTSFTAIVRQVSVTYTLFDPEGTPLRAEASLELEEVGGAPARQNPTSGGLGAAQARAVHQVVQGDTLAHLAARYYGDPTIWRVIAEANAVDDPLGVPAGAALIVPRPPAGTGSAEGTGDG